jgi:hypothetical protein
MRAEARVSRRGKKSHIKSRNMKHMKGVKDMKTLGILSAPQEPHVLHPLHILHVSALAGVRVSARAVAHVAALVALCAVTVSAQVQMPDPKAMSGSVLPVPDLPAGTVSVRVIRGGFDQNIVGQIVEFRVDGTSRTATTDAEGRATVSGLRPGSRVRAVAVVDGERLESQEAVVERTGLRIILVATDPEAATRAAEDATLASAAPVKGMVVLAGDSRVVAEFSDDRLQIFYLLDVVNGARTPVDIGGPLVFELPRSARGATVLQGSSKQATANGPRVTVTGPFAPGVTPVRIAYELPYGGPAVRLEQRWPAALQETTVIVSKVAGLEAASPQFSNQQTRTESGQSFILGVGPAIAAGQSLVLDLTGLPHHPRWPRYLALSLAGVILAAGVWASVRPARRR